MHVCWHGIGTDAVTFHDVVDHQAAILFPFTATLEYEHGSKIQSTVLDERLTIDARLGELVAARAIYKGRLLEKLFNLHQRNLGPVFASAGLGAVDRTQLRDLLFRVNTRPRLQQVRTTARCRLGDSLECQLRRRGALQVRPHDVAEQSVDLRRGKMQVCLLERRHDLLQLCIQEHRKTPGKGHVCRSQTKKQGPSMTASPLAAVEIAGASSKWLFCGGNELRPTRLPLCEAVMCRSTVNQRPSLGRFTSIFRYMKVRWLALQC